MLLDREKTMGSLRTEQEKTTAENKRLQEQLLRYEILDSERSAFESDVIELRAELKST